MCSFEPTEFRSWLSAVDAMTLLEITHGCISCRTESDFRNLFAKIRELVPFDHAFAHSARDGSRSGIVSLHQINISYPEAFTREYLLRNYFRIDTIVKDAFTTCRAQHCSETTPGRPKEITALCIDFGVGEGYVLGTRSAPNAGGSLFHLKSASMRHDRRAAAVLELVTPHLHLALSRVLESERPGADPVVALSAREREVMKWLNEGKSSWETSVILGVSERTVNFHVYNVLRKLGAANRPQALAIAARSGLLD